MDGVGSVGVVSGEIGISAACGATGAGGVGTC